MLRLMCGPGPKVVTPRLSEIVPGRVEIQGRPVRVQQTCRRPAASVGDYTTWHRAIRAAGVNPPGSLGFGLAAPTARQQEHQERADGAAAEQADAQRQHELVRLFLM